MKLQSLVLVLLALCGSHSPPAASEEPPAAAPSIRFSEHLIADKYAYAYGIAAADLDADGDLDLTSADYTPHDMLYLFENDGGGNFKRHYIQTNDPKRLERHMIGDVDGDRDLDVVIVKNLYGHLLWFENSGTPTDGKLWRRHVITTDLPGAYDVALADFDQDGDLDVAGSSWVLGNQFAWFENDGTPADGEWKKHLIEKDIPETRTMRAADFDGDGDADLLGTARLAKAVVWYENQRSGGAVTWKKHFIDSESPCPAHVNPADMDGDADGDIDVAATSWRNPGRVAWFENPGDPKGQWTRHILKDNWPSANQIIIADLNGDHRPDIAACAEHGSYELRWWRNEWRRTE